MDDAAITRAAQMSGASHGRRRRTGSPAGSAGRAGSVTIRSSSGQEGRDGITGPEEGQRAALEAIEATSGEAFTNYQVPLAILALQQGLGRLIRHRTDRGVLAVLDPRLRTMGYGRRFLDSLPPAPVTHDLDAVARFFM
jgi:hypothetical protein